MTKRTSARLWAFILVTQLLLGSMVSRPLSAATNNLLDKATHQQAQAAAAAELVGTVTDANGQAIPGVAVSLYAVISPGESDLYHLLRRTLTDDQGRYQFPNLAAGRYKLAFADVIYPERYLPEDYPDLAAEPEQASWIVLTGSQRQVDVQLALAGLLTGQVTDTLGQTLPNIWVALFRQVDSIWQQVNTATTLYDGSYTFTALAAGTYRLRFQDGGASQLYAQEFYNDATTLAAATDIVLGAGTRVEALATQLAPASQIRGRVTDQAGYGIREISVKLYHDPVGDGTWLPTDYVFLTDATGAYQISGLPAGVYRAEFVDPAVQHPPRYQSEFYNNAPTLATAADLTVGVGVTLSGIDAQLAATSQIQGQVTAENDCPLAHAKVILYQATSNGSWQELNQAVTDAAGLYDFAGLTAGTYRIGFAYGWNEPPVEFYANAFTIETAADIVVGVQATVSNINSQLPVPAAITGSVTGENGQELANISVRAWRQSLETMEWRFVAYAQTEANGAYQFNNLATGYYRLEFSESTHLLHRYEAEYYNDAATLEQATTIDVLNCGTSFQFAPVDATTSSVGSIEIMTYINTGPFSDQLNVGNFANDGELHNGSVNPAESSLYGCSARHDSSICEI